MSSEGLLVGLSGVPSCPSPGLPQGRRSRCPAPSTSHHMRGLIILWVDNIQKGSTTGGCDRVSSTR